MWVAFGEEPFIRGFEDCRTLRYDVKQQVELVTHLLSAWETLGKLVGLTARLSVRAPTETTCLGRKTPYTCMLHANPSAPTCDSTFK